MIDKTDPTNRDTVAAMLTPGEFVLNKEAVQLFGPKIEAMNQQGLQLRQARNNGGMMMDANAHRSQGHMMPERYNYGGQIPGYNWGGWIQSLFEPDENSVIGRQQAGELLPAHIQATPPGYGAQVPQMQDIPPEFVPQAQPGQQVQGGFGYDPTNVPRPNTQAAVIQENAADVVPRTDQALLETSSDAAADEVAEGYAAYSPADFLAEAQPQDLGGPGYDIPGQINAVPPGYGAEVPPAVGPDGRPFLDYDIAQEDLAFAQPVPQGQPFHPDYEQRAPDQLDPRVPDSISGYEDVPPPVDAGPGLGGAFAGYADLSQEELLEEALNPSVAEPSAEELAQSAFQNPDATEEELEAAKAVYNADTTDDDRARANDKLRKEVGLESTAEVKESLTEKDKAESVILTNSAVQEEVAAAPSPIVGQGNNPDEGATTDQVIETGKKASPKQMGEAKSAIKDAFGDLFDSKELARMGIIFAGALLTGASPGQALAIAGKGYLQRIDAKEANHQKRIDGLVKGGKYSPASIKAYSETGDPTDLIAVSEPPSRTGKFKTLYGPNGAVKVEEVKFGDVTKQVDAKGNIINEFNFSDDASSQTYTSEGRKRLQAESKEYAGILKEAQDVVIEANKAADKGTVNTGILPKAAGNEAAKWAIENNIPPAGMGRLLTNAFESAQRDGKSAKSIVPYLNEQFVQASVGDPTNFKFADGKTVPAQKTNQWLRAAANTLRRANPNAFEGKSNTEISQFILGSDANKDWNNLSTEDKASYAKQGKPIGYSGWMYYMNQQLQ